MLAGAVKIGCVIVAGLSVSWLWEASSRVIPAPRSHWRFVWAVAGFAGVVFALAELAG